MALLWDFPSGLIQHAHHIIFALQRFLSDWQFSKELPSMAVEEHFFFKHASLIWLWERFLGMSIPVYGERLDPEEYVFLKF